MTPASPVDLWTRLPPSPQIHRANSHNKSGQFIWYLMRTTQFVIDTAIVIFGCAAAGLRGFSVERRRVFHGGPPGLSTAAPAGPAPDKRESAQNGNDDAWRHSGPFVPVNDFRPNQPLNRSPNQKNIGTMSDFSSGFNAVAGSLQGNRVNELVTMG